MMNTMNQSKALHAASGALARKGLHGWALPVTAALLGILWVCAWWFEYNFTVALAVSLVLLVVGLLAHGIAAALAKRAAGREPSGMTPSWLTASHGDTRASIEPAEAAQFSARLNGKRWSLDVFEAIDAQRFAAVCETWFAWAGFETRAESHRTDEGVDIWLHAAKVPGPVAIVRCKHWLNKPVSLQDMKDFVGVMSSLQSVHGTYTTTSTYTPEALQFAKENGIDAVDGRGLLRRIQTRTRQRQQALLAVAFSGQH